MAPAYTMIWSIARKAAFSMMNSITCDTNDVRRYITDAIGLRWIITRIEAAIDSADAIKKIASSIFSVVVCLPRIAATQLGASGEGI